MLRLLVRIGCRIVGIKVQRESDLPDGPAYDQAEYDLYHNNNQIGR